MLYHACRKVLRTTSTLMTQIAKYQNFVMSDVLANIEKECDRYCPVPRFCPQKVCVVGAGSDVGRIACLLLKQQKVIKVLAMYDDCPERYVLGVANDIAHIDTSTEVQAFQGRVYLKDALYVCVVGAGSDVGRIACLFLKQQKVIKVLAMYDDCPERYVLGVANDIAHIDTSTEVQAFQGRVYLKDALYDSDVVLICGGNYVMPPCCNILDHELFFQNMPFVRTVALAIAQFAPQAIVAVQTPPVDCNFTLVKHTLKLDRVYDKRRLLGVNAINAMRANQLFCSITGTDPKGSNIPLLGGTGRCTRVPIFSAGKAGNVPQSQVECLTRLVREADDIICRVKSNNEQGHLSIGFSTARFVLNIMKGMFEKPTFIESALVEQKDPEKCFNMEICATPVTVGKGGIVEYAIPTLNDLEKRLLEQAKCDLEDMLNLGKCYALGDEYFLHPCKVGETGCKPCRVSNQDKNKK